MESVESIAQKLIPCTCGGYGENNRRHMSDCPRHGIAWEDHAAALNAERAKADTPAKPATSTPVEEMDALHDQATRIIEKIRHNYRTFGDAWSMNDEPMIRLRCAIATAIDNAVRAERAKLEKFAAFAGPDGEPRKVLGTLPVTASGEICGCQPRMLFDTHGIGVVPVTPDPEYVSRLYSTKQAAEDAANGIGGGT
jgi:hypothetical protein